MGQKKDFDVNWYFVRIDVSASYIVQVPANSEEEAIREAYGAAIPTGRLYNIDKTASISGPSFNEIMERWERRHQGAQRTQESGHPLEKRSAKG